MNELERRANFYLLMSAAAATLLGLMFVVITLAAERRQGDAAKIPIYLTPTVIYFVSVLFLAALLTIPNHTFTRGPVYLEAIKRVSRNDQTGLLTRFFHLRPTGSLYWAASCPSLLPNADSPWCLPVCCHCLWLRSATPGLSPSTSPPSPRRENSK